MSATTSCPCATGGATSSSSMERSRRARPPAARRPIDVADEEARPKPIRTILVPTDFSASAAAAISFVADLALHLDASITLLHVYPPEQPALSDVAGWS